MFSAKSPVTHNRDTTAGAKQSKGWAKDGGALITNLMLCDDDK